MTSRPGVAAQLVAAVIDAAPDRVRRRLDRSPNAAADWEWKEQPGGWKVETGGETVTLPKDCVDAIEQVQCTCLLSPNCFHVLACLSCLEVTVSETSDTQEVAQDQSAESEATTAAETVQTSAKQQHAAAELANSIAKLLQVGIANAGVVLQSSLLRAVHHCRAEGLHRAAASGLRVIAGIGQFRAKSVESEPGQLAEDVADVLETTKQIATLSEVANFWIGTARRKQFPVRPRKLYGLLAEPIITRSGFAGAAAYFVGEDDQLYTASQVRPGDAQLARDAYRGGIEIGSIIQPARQLARSHYLGTDLTASHDGRLGQGKSIKIVDQGPAAWQSERIQKRFQRPLPDQWNSVYSYAELPDDVRPAGWDFVFLTGAVVGALGPELLIKLADDELTIRLAIQNESEELLFRSNLRTLSQAPGLRLQIIGRMELLNPLVVYPLAITPLPIDDEQAPRLELPDSFAGRVFVGFDEIQRNHLINAAQTPMNLEETSAEQIDQADDPLAALRRRWIAALLAGALTQRQTKTNTMAVEVAALQRSGFGTGAALLGSLGYEDAGNGPESFLATAVYLRACRYELAKSRAMLPQ